MSWLGSKYQNSFNSVVELCSDISKTESNFSLAQAFASQPNMGFLKCMGKCLAFKFNDLYWKMYI